MKKSFQTKIIKKNLNPVWNETFDLAGLYTKDLDTCCVLFTVKDQDDILG